MDGWCLQMDNLQAAWKIHKCQNWAEFFDFHLLKEMLLNTECSYKKDVVMKNKLNLQQYHLTESFISFYSYRQEIPATVYKAACTIKKTKNTFTAFLSV